MSKDLTVSLQDVKSGYIVALKNDGDLVFELIGEQQGIVETLGLHEYAALEIQKPFTQMSFEKINQSIKLVGNILSKMLVAEKAKGAEESEPQS